MFTFSLHIKNGKSTSYNFKITSVIGFISSNCFENLIQAPGSGSNSYPCGVSAPDWGSDLMSFSICPYFFISISPVL